MEEPTHDAAAKSLETLSDELYPLFAMLRAKGPVVPAERSVREGRPTFDVTTWSDVDVVLRDAETFSSSINGEGTGRFMGQSMLAMDGGEHRSHRALITQAFRPSQLKKWENTLILPAINGLIDEIAPRGRAELVGDVISRFPVQVICGMFGFPLEHGPQFLRWAIDIHRGMQNAEVGLTASRAMRQYLEPIVEERRERPIDNDLISDIVHAEIDGQKLNDEEIYGFLRLLLPAGSESTYRAMSCTLFALFTVSGLLDRVRADRLLIPAVVEETLRWEPPLTLVSRVATRDTTLGGCPIPAGSALRVFTGSANHDEQRYANPEMFDLERSTQKHLTFGTGQHHCLGQHLARLELHAGLNAVLDRLPNLRLDPDHPAPVIEGFSFRGPKALHVLFDPA